MKRNMKAEDGEWFVIKFDRDLEVFSVHWCGGDDDRFYSDLSNARDRRGLEAQIGFGTSPRKFAGTSAEWFEESHRNYRHVADAFASDLHDFTWQD